MRKKWITSSLLAVILFCMSVFCSCGSPAMYTVNYECNGGRRKVSDTYIVGTVFDPTMPSKTVALTGATFTGWYYDEACTDKYDYKNPKINSDITLYAGWSYVHTVSFFTDTDENIEPMQVEYGKPITNIPTPKAKVLGDKTCEFDYWIDIVKNEKVEDGAVMGENDLNLFAVYKTGLSGSFSIAKNGDYVASKANALTYVDGYELNGYGSIEAEMTIMSGAGWAGIAFQMTDECKKYSEPFSQSDVSHYAFVILANPAGATQIVRRDGGSYTSCSTGWSISSEPLKSSAYAKKFAKYSASGESETFRMKVEIVEGRVNGYIWDDEGEKWELVCFATTDGQNSTGKANTTPAKYQYKEGLSTVGLVSQKSGVRFSGFKVTPAN